MPSSILINIIPVWLFGVWSLEKKKTVSYILLHLWFLTFYIPLLTQCTLSYEGRNFMEMTYFGMGAPR